MSQQAYAGDTYNQNTNGMTITQPSFGLEMFKSLQM